MSDVDSDTGGRQNDDAEKDELLRTVRTRRDKVLRFDGEAEDGGLITWFVAYRGKFGWSACRGTGEWMDSPTDDEVEWAIDEYDHVQLVDRLETPEEVDL